MSQILIPFDLPEVWSFDSFVSDDQQWVVDALKDWSKQGMDDSPFCWVWGGRGSGKSHLLSAVCYALLDKGRVCYFDLSNLEKYSPDMIFGLSSSYLICIDNIDSIAGHYLWEKSLFALYNEAVMMQKCKLIVSSCKPFQFTKFILPDLSSRMSQGLQLEVKRLAADQLSKALIFRANVFGFELSQAVANYLIIHFSSCNKCLFSYLNCLKDFSWQNKRKVTIPLVKDFAELLLKCEECSAAGE